MFHGRNFQLTGKDKNRYELKGAQIFKAGTYAEISATLASLTTEARHNTIELALMQRKLREMAAPEPVPAPPPAAEEPPPQGKKRRPGGLSYLAKLSTEAPEGS